MIENMEWARVDARWVSVDLNWMDAWIYWSLQLVQNDRIDEWGMVS